MSTDSTIEAPVAAVATDKGGLTVATLDRETIGPAGPVPRVTGHIPALDGLRGIAILAVMLCHFVPYSDHPGSGLGKIFFFAARLGWTGVDLFFVLSGFLITGILYEAKGSDHFFRNFYARRTVRIFPLYYGILAIIFLLIPLIHPGAFGTEELAAIRHRQGWLWTYGTNLAEWRDDWLFHADWLNLNPFWSLAVEEHFYLVWPLIVFLFNRRAVLWISAACMVTALVVRAGLHFAGGHDTGIYVLTPCRMDALSCGALLAMAMRGSSTAVRAMLKGMRWVLVLCGATAVYIILRDAERGNILGITVGYSSIAIFFGALLVLGVAAPEKSLLGKLLKLPFLRFMGKYSYGLYVYHVVLGSTFDRFFGQPLIKDLLVRFVHLGHSAYGVSVVLFIPLAITASIAVAWVSWNVYERQFLRLKKYFEYSRKPAIA